MNQTKIDTLSKGQTRKMTPYAREEQKGEKRCMTINQSINQLYLYTVNGSASWFSNMPCDNYNL